MDGRIVRRIARARSSVAGSFVLGALAYLLLVGGIRMVQRDAGRLSIVSISVLAVAAGAVGAVGAAERWRQVRTERKAGGAEVLAAANRASRFGERPVDPSLASAARAWVQRRMRFRRRLTTWAVAAYVAGAVIGVAVGYAGRHSVGYGFAVLFGLLAIAQPLNERSFSRYLAQAQEVLDSPDGPNPG